MSFFKASDTINGQEGKAIATINGEVHELFFVKNLEATVEKNKAEVKTLGKRGVQHKAAGYTGSGSMTIYYASSLFRKLMLEYMKTGKDVYFTLMITNEDPNSNLGKQTIALYNCNVDSVVLAKLDVDNESLDEDLDFTFDDAELLDEFTKPNYMN